jgi:hypothetical protein
MATSSLGNFCKAKRKERGARNVLPPYKAQKATKYGIPDSSRPRINDGALRSRGFITTTVLPLTRKSFWSRAVFLALAFAR